MTPEQEAYGPNVAQVLVQATKVVRGRIPASARKELMRAVKDGVLGHLKKDGRRPEVFFHPDHRHGAKDLQGREAEYSTVIVNSVIASASDVLKFTLDSEE